MMEKDKFDIKIIDIEEKSFQLGMLMSVFVFEILETFENNSADITAFVSYNNPEGGYESVTAERITLDKETGEIALFCAGIERPIFWDEFDLTAKDIIINELHHLYKSEKIFTDLSGKSDVH